MKQISILILLVTSFINCYSQNRITKNDLIKVLKIESGQKTKDWTICNSKKDFSSKDTIKLYSNSNYFYQNQNCCEFVEWSFYENNKFIEHQTQVCEEPSSGKVITENDFYTVKLKQEKENLYFDKYLMKKLVCRFRVSKISIFNLKKNNTKCHLIELIIKPATNSGFAHLLNKL